jgi:hypothetical protein
LDAALRADRWQSMPVLTQKIDGSITWTVAVTVDQ